MAQKQVSSHILIVDSTDKPPSTKIEPASNKNSFLHQQSSIINAAITGKMKVLLSAVSLILLIAATSANYKGYYG